PRTPCGVRRFPAGIELEGLLFQSTHPVWGATGRKLHENRRKTFQSTHPVWGATPGAGEKPGAVQFQSTHPVWGATESLDDEECDKVISIHAPRVGCDSQHWDMFPAKWYFNPRTPCGVRRQGHHRHSMSWGISIHAPRVGCDLCKD